MGWLPFPFEEVFHLSVIWCFWYGRAEKLKKECETEQKETKRMNFKRLHKSRMHVLEANTKKVRKKKGGRGVGVT
jgi:hypothetical protein